MQRMQDAGQEISTSSGDSAYDTLVKPSCSSQAGSSTPSSPSCGSEATNMTFNEAAMFAAVSTAAVASGSTAAVAAPAPLPIMVAPVMLTAGSTTLLPGTFVLPGMLPLEEVHPVGCSVQATTDGQIPMAAGCSKQYEIAARLSSTGSQLFDSSCMDASASLAQEVPEAATVSEAPFVPADGPDAVKVPLMQRAPRIKVKPRRADDPPRPLLEPSSPKTKKRAAGRMAAHPTSGHCCTQCGAVVSSGGQLGLRVCGAWWYLLLASYHQRLASCF